jgi:peptide maturation system protein (TIGR04066 family)
MYEKKKVLVFPYDSEFSPVLRHHEMMPEYTVAGVVSPPGWGINGKDAAVADGGDLLNITVNSDFESLLPICDCVLFSESEKQLDFEKSILPRVLKAAEHGKEILYLKELDEDKKKRLKSVCKKYNVVFKSNEDFKDTFSVDGAYGLKLHKINTPVIFVTGSYEKTQKFEIQLSLREAFSSLGYNISQIGSKNYCELIGFHSFPEFMFSCELNEERKIYAFNNYLKEIEIEENPDVIIIGIPGGIMRLNDSFTGKFGIIAYEVSQAVTPDVSVFSTFYEDFSSEYFEKLGMSVKYKLGFEVSCYNLSNVKFDWDAAKDSEKESYLLLDGGFIQKRKAKFNMLKTPVFNILNDNDRGNMASYLIDTLSYFGDVESV